MGDDAQVVLVPRSKDVSDLIEDYAGGHLSYRGLEKAIATMGYSTISLYEAVRHINPRRLDHAE